MKKFLSLLFVFPVLVFAQTFPVQNLQVNGNSTFAGTSGFTGLATFSVSPSMPTSASGNNTSNGATTSFVAAHAPCPSIVDYGADGTGVTFSDSAWTAVLAAQPAANVCVFFPKGIYRFNTSTGITLPTGFAQVVIEGVSDGSSILFFPTASSGIQVAMTDQKNSFHIRNLTVTTGSVGAAGSGIQITQSGANTTNNYAQSDLTNLNIRGNDGIALLDYWSTGISTVGAQTVNVVNVKVDGQTTTENAGGYSTLGIGMRVDGIAGSAQFAVIFNLVNVNFNYLGTGFVYGNYVQGVAIANSNFNGGVQGIITASGITGAAELSVVNSQFGDSLYGIHVVSGTAIGPMNISNNLIYLHDSNSVGVYLEGTQGFTIMGNVVIGPGSGVTSFGFNIQQNFGLGGIITGNLLYNLSQASSVGVLLGATSANVNVQSNKYVNVTTATANAGAGNTIGGGSP